MIIERKKNAVRGTLFGIILRIIQIVFPFIIRTIFIHSLGIEYLGLNSLFTAILQVLNLAELGVSSALVFSMYRPIVDNNTEKICQILNLYKRYYRIIGLVILLIGLFLVPIIPYVIKGTVPTDINIYIIYIMNLSATVLSYWLFAYRNSLFVAHQRNDIISIISIVINIIQYAIQVVVLLSLKNYYAYLIITILSQIANNIVTAILSKRYFPEYNPNGVVSSSEKKQIDSKVRDLFTSKIGGVINNSADSIVISSVLGLELLAVYQNYYYIISSIMAMFNIFFAACTAGIGNSLIVNSKEQNKELLYNLNHIVFLGICFCCTCFVSMCQPFMQLWVGGKYELPFPFVILFAVYLFSEEAPRTLIVFKDAGGIWKQDRFRPLISACVNLTLNIILTPFVGLYGIIISTISAMLFVSFPWVILNINKRLFPIGIRKYISRILCYLAVIIISVLISYTICFYIHFSSIIVSLLIRMLISGAISLCSFCIVFRKTDENVYLMNNIRNAIRKIYH